MENGPEISRHRATRSFARPQYRCAGFLTIWITSFSITEPPTRILAPYIMPRACNTTGAKSKHTYTLRSRREPKPNARISEMSGSKAVTSRCVGPTTCISCFFLPNHHHRPQKLFPCLPRRSTCKVCVLYELHREVDSKNKTRTQVLAT